MYSAYSLIRCLFLCSYLTSTVNVAEVLKMAADMVFPSVMRSITSMVLSNPFGAPSKSTVSRAAFSFDVALIMRMHRMTDEGTIRLGWADSSPTAGFDFVLSAWDQIQRADLLRLLAAVRYLCACRAARESGGVVADPEVDAARRDERVKGYMQILYSGIQRHNDPPVAVGKGCTNLGHKCAALLHKWWLQSGSEAKLLCFRASLASFCTDLGTEVGSPDFLVPDIRMLMPEWMYEDSGGMDLDVADSDPEDMPSLLT